MGGKRVGLARTQALIENLRRELSVSNSTFKSGTLEKFTVRGLADDSSGDGMQSGSVTAPVTRVQNINGEIITSITLDLENLSGSGVGGSTTHGRVIGRPGAQETASTGSYPAYLMQWDNDVNGICYKVEISAIETIAGCNANKHFQLSSSTLGTYEHGQKPTGDPTAICNFGGDLDAYETLSVTSLAGSPGDDEYIYLCNAANGADTTGKYSGGKIIIRFYGHIDF